MPFRSMTRTALCLEINPLGQHRWGCHETKPARAGIISLRIPRDNIFNN
jgi:hypothetical protein